MQLPSCHQLEKAAQAMMQDEQGSRAEPGEVRTQTCGLVPTMKTLVAVKAGRADYKASQNDLMPARHEPSGQTAQLCQHALPALTNTSLS